MEKEANRIVLTFAQAQMLRSLAKKNNLSESKMLTRLILSEYTKRDWQSNLAEIIIETVSRRLMPVLQALANKDTELAKKLLNGNNIESKH